MNMNTTAVNLFNTAELHISANKNQPGLSVTKYTRPWYKYVASGSERHHVCKKRKLQPTEVIMKRCFDSERFCTERRKWTFSIPEIIRSCGLHCILNNFLWRFELHQRTSVYMCMKICCKPSNLFLKILWNCTKHPHSCICTYLLTHATRWEKDQLMLPGLFRSIKLKFHDFNSTAPQQYLLLMKLTTAYLDHNILFALACLNRTFSVVPLQSLTQVQRGFSQQAVCFQGVVTPYFEIHLSAGCYRPTTSGPHKRNTIWFKTTPTSKM